MKNIEITADWILNNFHHTTYCLGLGDETTISIYCEYNDLKWNELALKGIPYKYEECENEMGEFQCEFHFELNDVADIAPEFYKKGMEIDKSQREWRAKNK